MPRVLLAWIGQTDLKASKGDASVGTGPIAQAVDKLPFDHVLLLNTYPKADAGLFEDWLGDLGLDGRHGAGVFSFARKSAGRSAVTPKRSEPVKFRRLKVMM